MRETVQVYFDDNTNDTYSVQHLTDWLRGKLQKKRQKELKWNGRVFLFGKQVFIYNVITAEKELEIPTTYMVYSLRDGTLFTSDGPHIHREYSRTGKLLRQINVNGTMRRELSSGILFFSNLTESQTNLYDRKTGEVKVYNEITVKILELSDGRIVTASYDKKILSIHDKSYKLLKTITLSARLATAIIEYKPGILLCCGREALMELNIDTEEQRLYEHSETTRENLWMGMLVLKNRSVALINQSRLQIFDNGIFTKSWDIEMQSLEQVFAQVKDNVVGYADTWYKNICIHDCISGEVTKYPIPRGDNNMFVSFIFE